MFDLDKIHPYYLSIKPESLTVDISVAVQSIKVTLTEKNTDKVLIDHSFNIGYPWGWTGD